MRHLILVSPSSSRYSSCSCCLPRLLLPSHCPLSPRRRRSSSPSLHSLQTERVKVRGSACLADWLLAQESRVRRSRSPRVRARVATATALFSCSRRESENTEEDLDSCARAAVERQKQRRSSALVRLTASAAKNRERNSHQTHLCVCLCVSRVKRGATA